MANRSIYLIFGLTLSCYYFSNPCYSETDTLHQGQEFKDWDYLISSNRVFILKFFGFQKATISPYLGIFYHHNKYNDLKLIKSPYYYPYSQVYLKPLLDGSVWVANRNNPVTDTNAKFVIDVNGKLSIISSVGTILDLFSPSLVARNASIKLLDSGNLVLQELYPDGSVQRILWQSFDYPTDTLLPGMKLGVNLKTGHRWSLTSWASDLLPAPGTFTLTADTNGTGQLVIMRNGNIHWMSGPWQGGRFKNTNLDSSGVDVRLYYVSNETEQSFTYLTRSYELFPALKMHQDGQLKGAILNFDVRCGSINDPGCAEYEFENLNCRKGYYVTETAGYYFENEYVYDESYNLTLYDCKRLCWSDCSCIAYIYATENKVGCKTYNKMVDTPSKARSSEYLPYFVIKKDSILLPEKEKNKWIWLIIGFGSLAPLISFYFVEKKFHIRDKGKIAQKLLLHKVRRLYDYIQADRNMNNELHYFTFQSISSATNNFSSTNKLGEGGFGAVYKGILVDGQEVAVKRLSRSSEQGVTEFKNETELIAKLQHTNLVRMIGCCVEKKEKILVYEYMPNNSLDFFLFDSEKKGLLDWKNRFAIINGIAQGLLYLHKFSRLRVIHRDLKASNILLDDHLNPKISDFGMAKLFDTNESEANTTRVVGTRGYMPPEYMMDGNVSIKTDVFSFGVLLLEIVSSKINHSSYDPDHPLNLLGLAWELWNENRGLELMDQVLEDSCSHKEVMTCIHVGLLCVQDHAMERPAMSDVIYMLTNEYMELPEPKRPAFYIERHEAKETGSGDDRLGNGSVNGQSVSIELGR